MFYLYDMFLGLGVSYGLFYFRLGLFCPSKALKIRPLKGAERVKVLKS
jgi:hypothetical protein